MGIVWSQVLGAVDSRKQCFVLSYHSGGGFSAGGLAVQVYANWWHSIAFTLNFEPTLNLL